ncbi:Polyhomeotic-proximal chromatin protein [Taenia crassiceps]|uniref:Polyhomeotic-proximal chromatin protein n=1 Tax=Taenia crassiceps TaxID=6207 RepID=A0ABR4QD18_9CEST
MRPISTSPRKIDTSKRLVEGTSSKSLRTRNRSSKIGSKTPTSERNAQVEVVKTGTKEMKVRKKKRKKPSQLRALCVSSSDKMVIQRDGQKGEKVISRNTSGPDKRIPHLNEALVARAPSGKRRAVSVGSSTSEKVDVKCISISSDDNGTPVKAAVAGDTSASSAARDDGLTKTGYLASQESSLGQTATQDTTKVQLETSSVAAKSDLSLLAPSKALSTSPPLPPSTTVPKSQKKVGEEAQVGVHSTPLSRSVKSWTTKQVVQLLRETPNCAPYAKAFEENEIDGEALTLLKFAHYVDPPLGMKVGHAAKFASRVLQMADNPSTVFHPSSFIASFLGNFKFCR